MSRANLRVECRAFVTKILFHAKRAVGVEYKHRSGSVRQARATEIILAGGAINSPQLLQLSGVGDAGLLRQAGVELVHDLPGVGENLQDHLEVYVQFASKLPVSVAPALKWRNRPMVGARWLTAAQRPRRHEPLRGRRFPAQQRRRRLPEPHVSLPADRHPLRRVGSHCG